MERPRRTHPRAPAMLGIRATDSRAHLIHAAQGTTAAESTAYRARSVTYTRPFTKCARARRRMTHHRAPATSDTLVMGKTVQKIHVT